MLRLNYYGRLVPIWTAPAEDWIEWAFSAIGVDGPPVDCIRSGRVSYSELSWEFRRHRACCGTAGAFRFAYAFPVLHRRDLVVAVLAAEHDPAKAATLASALAMAAGMPIEMPGDAVDSELAEPGRCPRSDARLTEEGGLWRP